MNDGTHLVICKNPKCLEALKTEESCCILIAHASEQNRPVSQGDALVARDELIEAGFKWGVDFYLKKVDGEN